MTILPPNLTELAKQGDPKAIATLMNRSLQPKGITANGSSRHDCLQLQLESAQVPSQAALVKFVQKGLMNLGVQSIKTVRIYGYQKGIETPAWEEEIELPSLDFSQDPLLGDAAIEAGAEGLSEMPEMEDLSPPPNPKSNSRLALILGAIALLLGLGAALYYFLFLKPQSSPPVNAGSEPATLTAPSAPDPSAPDPAIPDPLPSSASPTATASATPFRDAVNMAMAAATKTQTAVTSDEWQQTAQLWQQSIDLLGKVPADDANYAIAQQKINEYRRNLSYAQQRATAP
jgi:hypothetical protein